MRLHQPIGQVWASQRNGPRLRMAVIIDMVKKFQACQTASWRRNPHIGTRSRQAHSKSAESPEIRRDFHKARKNSATKLSWVRDVTGASWITQRLWLDGRRPKQVGRTWLHSSRTGGFRSGFLTADGIRNECGGRHRQVVRVPYSRRCDRG